MLVLIIFKSPPQSIFVARVCGCPSKKADKQCVYMFVCVRERGGKQRAHIAVCFNVGAGAGRATYLNMARLLTLHITVPPLQRPTMGYYHLASVNTSYAAELWTSEVGS